MNQSLDVILDLVGTLDDSPGEDTVREQFRKYLEREVEDVGLGRDLLEKHLREPGTRYACALQDFVNYAGHALGLVLDHGPTRALPAESDTTASEGVPPASTVESRPWLAQAMNLDVPAAVYADATTQADIDQTELGDDPRTEVTDACDDPLSRTAMAGKDGIAAPFFANRPTSPTLSPVPASQSQLDDVLTPPCP